ncbi:MAG: tyrosine-type recombinase/integrase [Cyanobacteria bacterium SZAS-4]|nr:tyrosine-type recombinase/integrase [Cyanobacteria bacterium SZAS-4]
MARVKPDISPKDAWLRIKRRARIDDVHLHDLRRTLGSWQAATGASLHVIGKTLNHKDSNTTAIYARLNLDPVRQAMENATDALLATIDQTNLRDSPDEETNSKKVIQFRHRKTAEF